MKDFRLFLCVLVFVLAIPSGVLAGEPAPPRAPDPAVVASSLIAVEPQVLEAASGGTISVYGTGFTANSVVRIVGYGLLDTTLVNETALKAQVPPGVPAGTYDVQVTDGSANVTLSQALTLRAPAPTPAPATPESAPAPGRPILTVRNYSVTPAQVRAGDEFVVTVEIYNNGSRAGENAMAVFGGGTFVPVGEPGHMLWQLHINHTAVITQRLRAPASLGSGVHQVQVELSANDWEGNHYDYPETVPVEVVGKSPVTFTGKPDVTIEGVRTTPAQLRPGAPFTLTLRLANRGSRTAINVFARCTSEALVIPAAGSDTVSTPKIALEDGVTVTLSLVLQDGIEGGRQRLAIALAYSDYGGGTYTGQENVGVDVDASLSSRPQLLLRQYRTDPAFVSPGDTFTLTLAVANVGGSDAERLTLALGGENGAALEPFSPLGAGNVTFVPAVRAGAVVTVAQVLIVDGAASPKAYNLPVALAYDDAAGSRHSDTQRMSLIVRRRPDVQATFYREPDSLAVGAATDVSLELVNVGRSTVNVTQLTASSPQCQVEIEGTPFVGPLDAGGAAPLDVVVTPKTDGPAEIIVHLTYRDDFNQPQTLTRTLHIDVGSSAPGGPVGTPAPAQGRDRPPALWRAIKGFLGLGS